jgi:hypothetical protein
LPGRYFENVVLSGLSDVTLHGCGGQTRIASASLDTDPNGESPPAPDTDGFAAVVTVLGSRHVQIRDVAVEAAADEVGILLAEEVTGRRVGRLPNVDVSLSELVVSAGDLPGILALTSEALTIRDSKVAMANALGQWPAIWVSGREISIERNWVGMLDSEAAQAELPAIVQADLAVRAEPRGEPTISIAVEHIPLGCGGIQIAGPARHVFVVENRIEGGRGNGITLGTLTLVDRKGTVLSRSVGSLLFMPDDCTTTVTTTVPPKGPGSTTVVAGGLLADILIARNRIGHCGLCGIGPVGFFDLVESAEVISVENLAIVENVITDTVLLPLEVDDTKSALSATAFAGAICLPDVVNLIVRDNTIARFGATPGAAVCGVFVLHAEMAEISRNHIVAGESGASTSRHGVTLAVRGGIVVRAVTPPLAAPADVSLWERSDVGVLSTPAYSPGLPALRVDHNVVEVSVGEALEAFGVGPFSVVNNTFSTGGTVPLQGTALALTVLLLNVGVAWQQANASRYSDIGGYQHQTAAAPAVAVSDGEILFSDNSCDLSTRQGRQAGPASVLVLSLDRVVFADNLCRVDAAERAVLADAFVRGYTVQVTSNRFQEIQNSAVASAVTFGAANITSLNISDHPLVAGAPDATSLVNTSNLVTP